MRPLVGAGAVVLARPLLGVSRTELRAVVDAAGMTPVEDPMNEDPRFERARLRRLMPALAEQGLSPPRLAAAAASFARIAAAIEHDAGDFLERMARTDDLGAASVDRAALESLAPAVRRRVLERLLGAIGGADYPPRSSRLEGLSAAIAEAQSRGLKRTLGGVIVEARGDRLLFHREAGRAGLPSTPASPGARFLWDGRFRVEVAKDAPRGLVVAALGEAGRRQARVAGGLAGAAAVPAIWRRDRLIAAPSLGFAAPLAGAGCVSVAPILNERLAEPQRFPDFGRER
jgi:tRNA(Ile)-lysidine synthase